MSNLREELLAIREQFGQLTPHNVVEAASAEGHPLHSRFEWDDSVAAHKYRLGQARTLIRIVKETYTDQRGNPADVRTFHAIPRADGMAYEPIDEIIRDDVASRVLLNSMEREWRQLKARYEHLSEFRSIVLRDLGTSEAA